MSKNIQSLFKEARKERLSFSEKLVMRAAIEWRGVLSTAPSLAAFRKPAVAVLASLLLLISAGGAVLAAASDAQPGDTLYPVKTAANTLVRETRSALGLPAVQEPVADEQPAGTAEETVPSQRDAEPEIPAAETVLPAKVPVPTLSTPSPAVPVLPAVTVEVPNAATGDIIPPAVSVPPVTLEVSLPPAAGIHVEIPAVNLHLGL